MIRFLSFLFGHPYETCKTCEALKQQLEFERSEKKLLIDTLVNIVSPKAVEAPPPVEINQIRESSALFSRRRAALEERDRQEAAILSMKKHVAVPDNLKNIQSNQNTMSVDQLEKELGIEEKEVG